MNVIVDINYESLSSYHETFICSWWFTEMLRVHTGLVSCKRYNMSVDLSHSHPRLRPSTSSSNIRQGQTWWSVNPSCYIILITSSNRSTRLLLFLPPTVSQHWWRHLLDKRAHRFAFVPLAVQTFESFLWTCYAPPDSTVLFFF